MAPVLWPILITHGFPIIIQILWKFHFTVTPFWVIIFLQIMHMKQHYSTALMSCAKIYSKRSPFQYNDAMFPDMRIPVTCIKIKIRQHHDCLIFMMGITISGRIVFILKQGHVHQNLNRACTITYPLKLNYEAKSLIKWTPGPWYLLLIDIKNLIHFFLIWLYFVSVLATVSRVNHYITHQSSVTQNFKVPY